ncbi:MAG TPA: hypothetical protein PKO33_00810, partial [Pyrinomonadaceae bacterium]|nr:hypothetical protein [Pyrinomonadaceae bacterium]
ADEKKTPIFKELGRLAFEGVTDELKNPTDNEKSERITPHSRDKETGWNQKDRDRDHRYAKLVRQLIHWMLMTLSIFLDPVVPGTTTHHNPFTSF